VASTLEGVLAQRLIRRLCKRCKVLYTPDPGELPPDFPMAAGAQIYRPVGCRDCRETGYSGRIGIFELLRSDASVRRMCVERVDSNQIRDYARQQGMQTLRESGWCLVAEGITTLDEVLRITKGDVV
jgi:general secretion pathway protein E/type IV pilus assembly protein PilB